MKKHIALFFQTPGASRFFQDVIPRHKYDDEIINIHRRRKDAKKNRIQCAGTSIEATHSTFDQLHFMISLYAIKMQDFEQDIYIDVHPKHYETIYNIIAELKP